MPDSRPTIMLIHGAWAGSWVWDKLIPLLGAKGLRTLTVDLPGSGECSSPADLARASLQGCVSHAIARLEGVAGPLFLLGHSGGGAVVTQVAETIPERIAGVIYVAGMMLPSGYGFAELTAEIKESNPEVSGITPFLEWSADRRQSRVPARAAEEIFFQDLTPKEARAAAARLTPQAEGSRALVPHWTPERFGRLPRLYVEALQDRSVVLAAQRQMQALVPGAEVASLDTGHAPQVAAPEALAEVVGKFVARQS